MCIRDRCKSCAINIDCNGWTTNNSGVTGGIIYGSTNSGLWRKKCSSSGGGGVTEAEALDTCNIFKRLTCCNW